jgi:hypothetical protein
MKDNFKRFQNIYDFQNQLTAGMVSQLFKGTVSTPAL